MGALTRKRYHHQISKNWLRAVACIPVGASV